MIQRERLAVTVAALAISGSLWAQGGRDRVFCEDDENCTDNTLRIAFGDATEAGADPAAFPSQIQAVELGEFTITVLCDVKEEGVQGWSVGIAHDPERIEILGVTVDGLTLPQIFFETTVPAIPRPGSPGFVSAVVLQIFPPPGAVLPVSDDTPLVTARYKLLVLPESELIEFSDDLIPNEGSPPTPTNFTISSQTKMSKTVTDGLVTGHVDPLPFHRGDANGDGVVNITDAAIAARNIFLGDVVFFRCDDMLDANDDGALSTADPVAIVSWLFLSGSRPPAPFGTCELDDDGDLDCVASNCL